MLRKSSEEDLDVSVMVFSADLKCLSFCSRYYFFFFEVSLLISSSIFFFSSVRFLKSRKKGRECPSLGRSGVFLALISS